MDTLKIFNHEIFGSLRVIDKDGEIWFVGKDVANALKYSNASKAVINHVEKEDKTTEMVAHSQSGNLSKSKTTIINESGMYCLVLRSKLEEAKRFKNWVTSEVLPQIRKTGGYIPVEPGDDKLTIMSKAMQIMNDTLEQQIGLIEVMKPKADFADTLRKSKDNISIGEFAKTLCDGGFEIGQNRLFKWLKNKKFLLKDNIPYQQYIVNGAFQVKRGIYFEFGGVPKQSIQTVITPKGQLYLFKKIKKDFDSGKIAS